MDIEPQKTDRELLEEIHANSRKTKNYLMWQLIITVALVVVPLLAMAFILPSVLSGLTAAYGSGGLLQ
jgi:hypothetical protein